MVLREIILRQMFPYRKEDKAKPPAGVGVWHHGPRF
jgi:hypothetical protein